MALPFPRQRNVGPGLCVHPRRSRPCSQGGGRSADRRFLPAWWYSYLASDSDDTPRQARTRARAARMTSPSVVLRPSDNRTDPIALVASRPMARSTADGLPCPRGRRTRSRLRSPGPRPGHRAPRTPGKETLRVFGNRTVGCPLSRMPGTPAQLIPQLIAQTAFAVRLRCRDPRRRGACRPRPTMDGTFSVPGRRPRSWPAPRSTGESWCPGGRRVPRRPSARRACVPRSRGGRRPARRRASGSCPPPAPRRCARERRVLGRAGDSSPIGISVPTSFWASMTVTSAVSPRTKGRASSACTRPVRVHRQPGHLDALALEQLARTRGGWVLDRRGDDVPP